MNTQSLIRKCNHKHDIKSITQNFKDKVQNDNGDYYCVNTENIKSLQYLSGLNSKISTSTKILNKKLQRVQMMQTFQ